MNYIPPAYQPIPQITYAEVLKVYSDVVINAMLVCSLMLLVMCVYINWVSLSWKMPTWKTILHMEISSPSLIRLKILSTMSWVFLPVALFIFIMLITYKLGVVI